ncbi:MAG: EpsG family protein [Taibaiella sp.]|jgi:hypothetical protein
MLPYLFILLLVCTLFICEKWIKQSWPYYILLIILILFEGFRDMIGGFDVYIYGQFYEMDYRLILLFEPFEPGFRLFAVLCKLIIDKREFFFFVIAMAMLYMHFRTIKRSTNLLYFALFIYFCKFYLFSFIYLRQGLAMGFIWFTLPYILNKKYLKASLLFALAFLFHKSSLIFLPMLFISNRRFNSVQLTFGIVVFAIVFASPIGQIVSRLVADASENNKLNIYAEKHSAINIFYVAELLLFTSLAFIFKKYFYQYKETMLIFNGFIFYILMSIVGLTNGSFVRLAWYFFIFVVLAIPFMYSFLQDQKLKTIFKSFVFVYYIAVFLRLLFVFDNGDFMPYKTIFQDFDREGMWDHMEYRKR